MTETATFKFGCPQCGQHIAASDDLVGSQASCPNCNAAITIPTRPALPRLRSALDAGHGETFGMDDAEDLGVGKAVSDTVTQFKSLDYGFLLPFRKIFSASLLRKKAVRWVCLFGLMPIAIYVATDQFDLNFEQTVWLLQLYFCLFWALYFYSLIRPTGAIWRRAIGYATFTAIIGIPLLFIAQALPIVRHIYAGLGSDHFLPKAAAYVFGVGPFEELCKALPLLWFGLRKNKLNGIREGLFLGLMSGFGFAAAEGVLYTLGATMALAQQGTESAFTGQMLQTYFRLMSGPVLHGAWAGTVGWFIGLASTRTGARWPIIAVGVVFAALLHGFNDVVAGTWFHIPVAAVSILVFMAYLIHGEEEKAAETGVSTPATET